jgi:very-short-patch-repair endonuclease
MTSGFIRNQHVSDKKKGRSRELRKHMTEAEIIFWDMVRNKRLNNLKFRRQQVINRFIVDFFCCELNLCVEIDGDVHNDDYQREYDKERDVILSQNGLKIIRIKNEDVLNCPDNVRDRILIEIFDTIKSKMASTEIEAYIEDKIEKL